MTATDVRTDSAVRRPAPAVRKAKRRRLLVPGPLGLLRILILLGFAVFCIVPMLWLLLAITKTDAQLRNDFPLSFGSLANIPKAWDLLTAANGNVIVTWTINSLIYVTGGMLGAVGTSLLAGYALAALKFRGRKVVLWMTLITMVMPGAVLVLPIFLELSHMGLIDSKLSVILTSALYPFGTYLAYVYFSTSLPKDLLEAARIDGCSEWRIFRSVAVPTAAPLIGLLAYFSFIANWTNYYGPYMYLSSSSNYNLPVGLGALMNTTPGMNAASQTGQSEIALVGAIIVFPIALLFIVMQRYLNRGMLGGSLKG